MKNEKPIVAICYDFDKTLSPDDMQAQGFIQENYDGDVQEFWNACGKLAEENEMDGNLAYMYMMLRESQGKLLFNKKTLMEYGSRVELFPGVSDWFKRINQFGEEHGVEVEHYIISSGLKEMIEGTTIASDFTKIYASSFLYNEYGLVEWPAMVINYTNKTQFLFRISKGCLDVNDAGVNELIPTCNMHVPFTNMVYCGDSDTDVPCMQLINKYNGYSVGIYNPYTKDRTKVDKMLEDGRIKYAVPGDYTEGSEIDTLIKGVIVNISQKQ